MNKKTLAVSALAIALIAGGVFWYQKAQPAHDPLTAYGTVDLREVYISFEESGRVTEMLAKEGDTVKKGDVLAKIDDTAVKPKLDAAEAALRQAQATLDLLLSGTRKEDISAARAAVASLEARLSLASITERRQNTLAASGATSKESADQAKWNAKALSADLQRAKAELQKAVSGPRKEEIEKARAVLSQAQAEKAFLERSMRETVLVSPADGVIRSRLLEPGDMASPAKTAYLIAKTDPKWVRAYVTENQLGCAAPGVGASVASDTSETLRGTVGYVSSVAEFTPKTVQTEDLRPALVYEVRVNFDDPRGLLRLGQPVTVRFDRCGKPNTP